MKVTDTLSIGFFVLILAIVSLLFVLMAGCGAKKISSNYIEYQGLLDGDFRDSEKMVESFEKVGVCMDLTGEYPLPNLRVMGCPEFEGCNVNAVPCPGYEEGAWGCYFSGSKTISLPANVKRGITDHELVHYFCDMSKTCNETQDLDSFHTSEYFLKCSGLKLE